MNLNSEWTCAACADTRFAALRAQLAAAEERMRGLEIDAAECKRYKDKAESAETDLAAARAQTEKYSGILSMKNRELSAARAENERLRERRFPIQGGPSIPWRMILPHEDQAKRNHSQTLEDLARRGGLSPMEALWVLDGKKITWQNMPNPEERRNELERRRVAFEDRARPDDGRVMPETFVDEVREAMATSWHEYVNDSHSHPGEFEMRGKELWANFERGGNWSRWVAQRIWSKARAVLEAADGVKK